ncbi:chemotaxis response regulator protein-glutamate methylesterase [Paenibacillus oralis]|uniref:Protein-glutamate methylesterase/protein-glutamine glutaminase n=1 Tax=Paenibacillus oralis TaxID=2490856 RepID=A0A3P3U526_9BACL|nr:chemotaxis response regulator protein-glutamate methylesterase [Paenibacillus oralis]RRJ65375.1 chemotaxis response regulator protein-glutamate methylesterase [Paenibacillus oralis]
MSYRVLVVDDSAFMRKIVSDLIEQDPDFKVEATAKNGREAIEQIAGLKPDLVTMDVEMPEMNGLDALKVIMKEHPLPVIMLSGINEQGMRETIMALELGAFDFIRKPSASTSSHDIAQVGRELREQIRGAMLAAERKAAREAALRSAMAPPADGSAGAGGKAAAPSRKKLARPAAPPSASGAASPPAPGAVGSGGEDARLPRQQPGQAAAQPPAAPAAGRGEADRRPPQAQGSARPAGGPPRREPLAPPAAAARAASARQGAPAATPKPPLEPAQAEAAAAREAAGGAAARSRPRSAAPRGFTDLVAIGTSTGGPKALKAVLEKIPADFPAPIVIVQHMPPNFTKSLAQRLNSLSGLNVVEAEEGMELLSGTAYIAPGGFHLNVVPGPAEGYRLHLSQEEPCNGHRPSVDVLYKSLLPLESLKRHIVLLTGMGSDGAKAMKRLYDAGVTSTIAESEETCVVFGMPRSAIELKCVSHVLPLQEIGPKLVQVVK